MADVWLAHVVGPEGFEKQVVIKTLLPALAINPEFTQMFLNEARLAARLNHPNCVQIFDLGFENSNYFIAMEFIDGFPLSRMLGRYKAANKYMPPELAARVVAEAASGLEYAHRLTDRDGSPLNLVHRDVSPDNILVSFGGQVKMVDFGVAKISQKDGPSVGTVAGQVKGKIAYMSPEYLLGDPIDGRSDVFALGVVLYIALTYVKPFHGATDAVIMRAIMETEPVPPSHHNPHIPPALEQVVLTALAKEPVERFASARAMREAIEAALPRLPSADTLADAMESLWPKGDVERSRITALAAGEASNPMASALGTPVSMSGKFPRTVTTAGTPAVTPSLASVQAPLPPPGANLKWAALGGVGALLVAAVLFFAFRGGPAPQPVPLPLPVAVTVDAGPALVAVVPPVATPAVDAGTEPAPVEPVVTRPIDKKDPVKAQGKVDIASTPAVDVFLKGRRLGRAPGVFPLAAGSQALTLSNQALGIERQVSVVVTAGQTSKLSAQFARAWLDIRASPWAEVTIDGHLLGTTPLPEQELFEGTHRVELFNADTGAKKKLSVGLAPGEHKVIRESMK